VPRCGNRSRVDRLATTSIETREPLLEGHTLLPPRSFDSVPSQAAEAERALVIAERGSANREPPSASGRFYRPFHALADDGSSTSALSAGDAAATGSDRAPIMTPHVGAAMEDIMLFADEMQRDLAHHGTGSLDASRGS
jgi:hypothetical protein